MALLTSLLAAHFDRKSLFDRKQKRAFLLVLFKKTYFEQVMSARMTERPVVLVSFETLTCSVSLIFFLFFHWFLCVVITTPTILHFVVQITGCSSGLGEALALALHNANFHVVATARRLEAVDHLAALGIECLRLDVTDDESVKLAVSKIVDTNGRLDILINNAGLSAIGPIAEQPLSEVSRVFEANVLGVIRVTQAAVPIMANQGSGLILNIGSVVSQLSTPWSAAYSASKAALLCVTDALRLETKPFGIGVTYVTAGAIEYVLSTTTILLMF